MRRLLLIITLTLAIGICQAADSDYKTSKTYLALRDSMHRAFNDGDSARFFPALSRFQDYLLEQNDLHAYYTQRCNEIVFLMNQQKIYEAYKAAQAMTQELREKKLDKEMYMAKNMLGHINRYCDNKEEAKKCWYEALEMMEREKYYANMPPIYMNIVNVALDDSYEEADSLLDIARKIALKYAPERVFDIETRQSLSYYYRGDYDRFLEGYKAYKEGKKKGLSSVHGRSMEVHYLALKGQTDAAIKLAKAELGDEGKEAIVMIYEKAGRWEEAFKALKEETATNDSIDNVVIQNSMEGIRTQVQLYDVQRKNARTMLLTMAAMILLLCLLIVALIYIVQTRRQHLKELTIAYKQAQESEKMKAAFIRNISHEIRTPLNIISGFAQVIADPELTDGIEERQHIADMMQKNAHQVTTLLDEIIGLSLIESTSKMRRDDIVSINKMLREQLKEYEKIVTGDTKLRFESTLADDFTLQTNENMLKRIISALLENASKYTQKGSITLRAVKEEEQLVFTIEDTGCGIPAEEAEHIFERFVKLNTFKEGIGLGLPLSRKLAQQLGGEVIFDPSYTNGARFIVKIKV